MPFLPDTSPLGVIRLPKMSLTKVSIPQPIDESFMERATRTLLKIEEWLSADDSSSILLIIFEMNSLTLASSNLQALRSFAERQRARVRSEFSMSLIALT